MLYCMHWYQRLHDVQQQLLQQQRMRILHNRRQLYRIDNQQGNWNPQLPLRQRGE